MALPAEEIDHSVKLLLDPQRIASQGFDNSSTALLQRWIGTKPQDAARWILDLPSGPSREAGVGHLASEWLQSDAAGTLQWLSAQPSHPLRRELGQAMAKILADMPDSIRTEALQSASPAVRQQLEEEIQQLQPPPGDSEAPTDEESPDAYPETE
jgi:hypothetical protein